MTNLYFTICALFVSLLLVFMFFVKKTINNRETGIFKFMLFEILLCNLDIKFYV